jgi:tRNA-2-methylthio-N6-dimethylallyladenosine synthase
MTTNQKLFHIQTFGCQMNERDSETLAGMLTELGYEETTDKKAASVAIINTCSVRENADKRFFGTLGQLKKIKEVRPDFVVCICGCMMQQQHIIDTVKSKYPWVDLIFGTHNIHAFPALLQNVKDEKIKQVAVLENGGDIVEGLPAKREFRHKAFVNIMYGCDNFCTYCIVPFTRGRERSRKPEDILKEVYNLVDDGVKEITLLGQNVNSYRGVSKTNAANPEDSQTGENGETVDFADLIHLLNKVEGLERIRFMTSHPKDLSEKLIDAYTTCGKLKPYIHLPVQSGSDNVLQRMNRKYTAREYLDLVDKLKEVVPDLCITTDIIVGFPGETDADFEETLALCRKVQYDSAFTFIYSVRKGTPAEHYGDQVPESIKHERFNRLVEAINHYAAEKNAAYVGRVVSVLVDGQSKTDPAMVSGRTETFKLVDFPNNGQKPGDVVNVEITQGKTFSLRGIESR